MRLLEHLPNLIPAERQGQLAVALLRRKNKAVELCPIAVLTLWAVSLYGVFDPEQSVLVLV